MLGPKGRKVNLKKTTKSKTKATYVGEKEYLGYDMEGEVRSHEFKIGTGQKNRSVFLAVKKYYPNFTSKYVKERLEIMQELHALNRMRKKMGESTLRLFSTFRIIEKKGEPHMLASSILNAQPYDLTREEKGDWFKDASKQLKILHEEGYIANTEAFLPYRDPKTKKIVAIIGDSGGVKRKTPTKK
ncbi:MAG: hypothetical protein V1672_03870 [Candidatus Diapherotrites archaeon]